MLKNLLKKLTICLAASLAISNNACLAMNEKIVDEDPYYGVHNGEYLQGTLEKAGEIIKFFEQKTGLKVGDVLGYGNNGLVCHIEGDDKRIVKFTYSMGGMWGTSRLDSPEFYFHKYASKFDQNYPNQFTTSYVSPHMCAILERHHYYWESCPLYNLRPGHFDGYLILQYVPGTPLDQYVKKNGCSYAQIIKWGLQLLDPLLKLQLDDWRHRDVQDHNILVTNKDEVVLVDLGNIVDMRQIKDSVGRTFLQNADLNGLKRVLCDLTRWLPQGDRDKIVNLESTIDNAASLDDLRLKLEDLQSKLK